MSNKVPKFLLLLLLLPFVATAADYKAGVARLVITPDQPMYLSGYANRTHASEGKVEDSGPKPWPSKTARADASSSSARTW